MKTILASIPLLYITLFLSAVPVPARTTGPFPMVMGGSVSQFNPTDMTGVGSRNALVTPNLTNISTWSDWNHDGNWYRDGKHDRDPWHNRKNHDDAPAPTPEPATAVLTGIALLVGGGIVRFRNRRSAKQI